MQNPLAWIDDALNELEVKQLRRHLAERHGAQSAARIQLDGNSLVNFGSNDYLGLAADPRVIGAACGAAHRAGWGSAASPLISGRESLHQQLESSLARFEQTESALLFPTGFAANVGAIAALVGRGDIVFSDAENHASIIDGCRLSRARVQVYPHADVDYLRSLLVQAGGFRKRLIVTDSLFSMRGDLAPLGQLCELADQFQAMLYVDEAHATGVFGRDGRGVSQQLDVEDGVHIRVGTLSKSLGSQGGFVAGSELLIQWLANQARPYIFSTASPAAACAAALESLRIVQLERHRRSDLLRRAEQLHAQLRQAGFQTGSGESQIIPIQVGSSAEALRLAAAMYNQGFFVPPIRPPSVPAGSALLRIGLCFPHGDPEINGLVTALRSACVAPSERRSGSRCSNARGQ